MLKNIDFHLKLSPEFWDSLSHPHRMGLLKHELLHIGFFHLTDFNHLVDKQIANIAMDLEINQYIDASWLPEGGMTLDKFPELNLEPKKGTRYYYDKLMEEKKAQQETIEELLKAMANGESSCQLPNGETVDLPQHDWDELEIDDTKATLVRAQTGHILTELAEQVEKSRGTVPGEFSEVIKRLQQVDPPKFDWKGYMRRFIGKSKKTYTKKTRRKFNKRLPDFPGLKIKMRNHVLAAVDTSASVNARELKEFLAELYHITKTGTEVTIIQCDTAISFIGKFDPKKDWEIHGRGGTDFQPVVDYFNENMNQFSCLFYFTDGEAPSPHDCRGNVLWVLSEESTMNESLPGHVIQLN
jgi:predicted metal-dependent peptidase